MRSKRLHTVLANSKMLASAKSARIQQQQTLIENKIGGAHTFLEDDGASIELKRLVSANVRSSLGRSRHLAVQAQKHQQAVLKAAQLEAGAKRRHKNRLAAARKEEGRKQLNEIIDAHVGKPPASQN